MFAAVRDAIDILAGGARETFRSHVRLRYVETGILRERFLELLYRTASHVDPAMFAAICAEYRDRPYGLLVLAEDHSTGDHDIHHCLSALKGKMSTSIPRSRTDFGAAPPTCD